MCNFFSSDIRVVGIRALILIKRYTQVRARNFGYDIFKFQTFRGALLYDNITYEYCNLTR